METEWRCIKTLFMSDTENSAFTEGNVYKSITPKDNIWPDHTPMYCFIDDQGGEHFMDKNRILNNFIKVSPPSSNIKK